MRNILLLLLLPLLAGCGAFQGLLSERQTQRDVGEVQRKVDDVFGKVQEGLDKVQQEVNSSLAEGLRRYQEVLNAADTDKDGKLGGYESILAALLGVGGVAEMARRKFKGQDEKAKALTETAAELEARIEHEREKRKDSEVALLKAQLEALRGAPPKA